MYGLLFITSQALSAFAFAIIVVSRLADVPPLRNVLTAQRIARSGQYALCLYYALGLFSFFTIFDHLVG